MLDYSTVYIINGFLLSRFARDIKYFPLIQPRAKQSPSILNSTFSGFVLSPSRLHLAVGINLPPEEGY